MYEIFSKPCRARRPNSTLNPKNPRTQELKNPRTQELKNPRTQKLPKPLKLLKPVKPIKPVKPKVRGGTPRTTNQPQKPSNTKT